MRTVIYNVFTGELIKVVENAPNFFDLKNDEDFMPVCLWNSGCESSGDLDKIIN
jgi:hypothetical protein